MYDFSKNKKILKEKRYEEQTHNHAQFISFEMDNAEVLKKHQYEMNISSLLCHEKIMSFDYNPPNDQREKIRNKGTKG